LTLRTVERMVGAVRRSPVVRLGSPVSVGAVRALAAAASFPVRSWAARTDPVPRTARRLPCTAECPCLMPDCIYC
jgi:hypothetical protein